MAKSGLFGTGARVGPISQTAIQPTGIPGSTFVRAPVREAGGNLSALADALGVFNSSLQNFASVQKQQEEDPQSRANKEWIARRQQMSLDDLINEANNNTHDGIRIRQDAVELLLAERANSDLRQRWLDYYNTEFDRTSGDAAAEYEQMRQGFAERLPSDVARGHLYRLTDQHFQSWMEQDVKSKAEFARGEMHTTITGSFRSAVDDARAGGVTDANELAKIVFQKSAGNRTFLGLSGQEQNATIFELAREYAAQGDEEMVRALLESPRTGADGKSVGPLGTAAEYRVKALELIEQASNRADRRFKKEDLAAQLADDELVARGEFTEAEARKREGLPGYDAAKLSQLVDQSNRHRATIEAKVAAEQKRREAKIVSERAENGVYAQAYGVMDRFGGINRIRDVEIPNLAGDGTRTLSRETVIEAVIEMKEEALSEHQQVLVAGGMDSDQARETVNRHRLDWYAGNVLINDAWSNTLNGIAGRATTDTMLQKGEVSQYLKASANLYRQLKAANVSYVSRLLTDKTSKDFLEAYDRAIVHRRMPEDDALLHAAMVVSQPEGAKAKSMMNISDTADLAERTLRNLGLDVRSSNHAYVVDRIASMSMHGATEREIKKEIEREVLDTAVPINGMLVFTQNDLPDDFPDLMQVALEERFAEYGERYDIEDLSDLYVAADSTGTKWHILSKSRMMPVGSEAITTRGLEALRQRREEQRTNLVLDMVRASDADRAEYQRQFEADIAKERAMVEKWENAAASRGGLRKSFAAVVAKRLRDNYEERITGAKRSAYVALVRDSHEANEEAKQKRYEENLEFLKSFLPEVKINNKDAYEMYRNRTQFDSFGWAADTVKGWFD